MKLIDADALLDSILERYCADCDRRKGIKNGKYKTIYEIGEAPCRACQIDDMKAELEDAPSAQSNLQPTCNYLQPTCNQLATDCISRQMAIEEFAKKLNADDNRVYKNGTRREYAIGFDGIKQVLESLPSAQPTHDDGSNALDALDCVSRQALCDDLREYKVHPVPISSDESEVKGYNDGIDLAISVIAEFPSARPERKTGKWEHLNRCSECGFGVLLSPYMHNLDTGEYTLLYNFCPNCGCAMKGENDETD